jgi:class 3 adenylate cyclase/TolB-like protein/Tfp pilus assembly protein PilF
MERRLTAILAADVEGYSRHTEDDEEASTVTLRSYCAVQEEAILAHRGHIFSRAGDGVVAEFPSIVEAIRCAIEIQSEIAERNASLPEDRRMQFRIGVNLGDVIAEEDNLYGTGVNVAVRLQQLAEPGGICVSQTVYDQVRKIIEIPFQDIGERRLKNIADPVHIYRILPAPLPWFRTLFSRANVHRRRLGVAGSALILLVALVIGAFHLRQPPELWNTLLGGGLPQQTTLAILPFTDRSPKGQETDYLAAGIADQLKALAKFSDLMVVDRASGRDQHADAGHEGEDFDERYAVRGSVQRDDDKVRVAVELVELIEASKERPIWYKSYNYTKGESLFAVRDDVTRRIAGTLGGLAGKIAQAEAIRLSEKNPTSLTAYDHVVLGWAKWNEFKPDSNKAAQEHFDQALKINPRFARAYAGLAWTYSSAYDFSLCDQEWTDDPEGALASALENAEKAVKLARDDYVGHWVLGWAYLYNGKHELAKRHYALARKLNGYDTELLGEMSNLLVYTNQLEQAIEQLNESRDLNERADAQKWYLEYLGWANEQAGMPGKAVEQFEQVVADDPEQCWLLPSLAAAYAHPSVGQMDKAHDVAEKILKGDKEFSSQEWAKGEPYETDEQRTRFVNALIRAGLPN